MATTPYPGLRPYQETEQTHFYGRDTDTATLLEKIPGNRLTLLFAATGVGKSSLLQASILPRLKATNGANLDVVYYNDWVAPPLNGLQQAVRQALQQRHGTLPTTADNLTLADFFRALATHASQPLVVVLDQFEEFFRYRFVHHRDSFQPFIDQLTDVILAEDVPVSLVFSMREDFALELNAFKPHLPNPLFGNYYRLEKLSEAGARTAITAPLAEAGYQYEPALLEQLLHDLLSRDLSRDAASLAQGASADSVEPPYLQIVCSQLWELDKNDPQKTLRLATYRKAGGAKGLLENYVNYVLKRFSDREKQLASKAFDHLISRRGTKMAYTPEDLANLIDLKPAELARVLDKLENARILRRQQRDQTVWYELYHDMFSGGIESWNTVWKNHMRLRRTIMATGASLLTLAGIGFGVIAWLQASSKHLRLGTGNTDRVEVYTGTSKFPDPFQQQRYAYETSLGRNQLELDKRYPKRDVQDYANLGKELIGSQPADARFSAYIDNGDYCQVSTLLGQVLPSAKAAPGCTDKRETLQRQPIPAATPTDKFAMPAATLEETDPLRDSALGSLGLLKTQWGLELLQQVAGGGVMPEMYPGQWSMMLNPLTMPIPFDETVWLTQIQQNGITGGPGDLNDPRKLAALLTAFVSTKPTTPSIAQPGIPSIAGFIRDYIQQTADVGLLQAVARSLDIVPALRSRLDSKDMDQREASFLLLARLQDPSAIDGLGKLFDNDQPQPYLFNFLDGLDDARLAPLLLDTLRNARLPQETRIVAANALGNINADSVIPVLLERLNDQGEWELVRRAAATALGRIGDTRAAPVLLDTLRNPQERGEVRMGTLEALVAMAYQEAVPTLLERFADPQERPEMRGALVSALAVLGKREQTVPVLLAALQNPHEESEVLRQLPYALAILGDNRAVPALPTYRNSLPPMALTEFDTNVLSYFDDPQARQIAQTASPTALRALKGKLEGDAGLPWITFIPETLPAPIKHWSDISSGYYGLQPGLNPAYLPVISDHNHRQALLDALNTTDPVQRAQALLKLALDESAHFTLRSTALSNLMVDDRNATSTLAVQLEPLLKHSNVLLKRAATEAYIRLQSGVSLLAYAQSADFSPDTRENALRRVADTAPRQEAINALLKFAGDETSPLQPTAIQLLGIMQAREALPILENALDALEREYRDWRNIRDQRPEDDAAPDTFSQWQQTMKQAEPRHAYLAAHYGYALARIDDDKGMAVLAHDLADVRDGAATAFAQTATPTRLQALDAAREQRQHSDPMFAQVVFHAIDKALTRLEGETDSATLQQLESWQTAIKERPDADAVRQRLDWTLAMIRHNQTLDTEFKAKYGVIRQKVNARIDPGGMVGYR